jgi:hypothetical protein
MPKDFVMRAEIIRFPVVPARTPHREDPMTVVRDALCRMNLLMSAYVQPRQRYDPEFILMKINEILQEPELSEATGIEKIQIIEHEDL